MATKKKRQTGPKKKKQKTPTPPLLFTKVQKKHVEKTKNCNKILQKKNFPEEVVDEDENSRISTQNDHGRVIAFTIFQNYSINTKIIHSAIEMNQEINWWQRQRRNLQEFQDKGGDHSQLKTTACLADEEFSIAEAHIRPTTSNLTATTAAATCAIKNI